MTQSSTFPAISRQMYSIASGKPSFLHHPQADIIPLSYRELLHHLNAQAFRTAPTPLMHTVIIKIYDKCALWHDKKFPLQCSIKEYNWIPLWTCELIYSKSGIAELDGVFTTNFPGDVKQTWYD